VRASRRCVERQRKTCGGELARRSGDPDSWNWRFAAVDWVRWEREHSASIEGGDSGAERPAEAMKAGGVFVRLPETVFDGKPFGMPLVLLSLLCPLRFATGNGAVRSQQAGCCVEMIGMRCCAAEFVGTACLSALDPLFLSVMLR
jgi:hypothetical protein